MRSPTMYLLAALGTAVLGACASSGTAAGNSGNRGCVPAQLDSTYAALAPVYRNCDVDVQARAMNTDVRPESHPGADLSCMSAVVQFVVDENGRTVPQTAKVVSTNSHGFAQAVLDALPAWHYRPATKGGQPVREVVQLKKMVLTKDVMIPVTGAPRQPSPFNLPPADC